MKIRTIVMLVCCLLIVGCAGGGARYLVDESTVSDCPAGQMKVCQTLGGRERCGCERRRPPSDIFR